MAIGHKGYWAATTAGRIGNAVEISSVVYNTMHKKAKNCQYQRDKLSNEFESNFHVETVFVILLRCYVL